jgi:nicotinamidase-related amidase
MSAGSLLDRGQSVISVIDIQERLTPTMIDREDVMAQTVKLLRTGFRLGVSAITTEQYPKGLGPTEAAIVDALGEAYLPIEKLSFGCCGEPAYMDALEKSGREQVVVCGMETHVCVLQTCVLLLKHGYEVHVVADAVCSRNKYDHDVALDRLRDAGVALTTVDSVIWQWLREAGTPEFKDVLGLIKG